MFIKAKLSNNINNVYIKFGFTLAEVLITLMIIGVVASLTIPALINNVNNTTNVVQLKKTFYNLPTSIYDASGR